jgi:ATP-binding cassette, subfamily B, bacterial PglK
MTVAPSGIENSALKGFPLLRECLQILDERDQKKLALATLVQSFLGLLDLIGVGILGIIGALSIRGVQSQMPGERVGTVLKWLNLEKLSFQNQVATLTVIAVLFFLAKTVLAITLSRRILLMLSRKSAEISSRLTHSCLTGNYEKISNWNTMTLQYAIGPGVNYIGLGIIGLASTIVSDSVLLVIMSIGLLLIDPSTFLISSVFFGIVGALVYKVLHARARRVGMEMAEYNMKSNQSLNEALLAYREIYVRNKELYYANQIGDLKRSFAHASAEQTFLPNVSKYIIEISVTLGAVLVAAIQFATQDAPHAIASLTLFLAAGSRLAPALLRIQQSAIQMQGNFGGAKPTLELIRQFETPSRDPGCAADETIKQRAGKFVGSVKFDNVSFKYSPSEDFSIRNITFEIQAGQMLAVVGPSGSGKSTIIDLLLGLLKPTHGSIELSELDPGIAISTYPNSVSYVPQSVSIFEDSIARNIALGCHEDEIDFTRVMKVLEITDLVSEGFTQDSNLLENGKNLSGGQKQRIGISRALYNYPGLLILDEATSALDSQTENNITGVISGLKGDVTLIVIAHRLSTIRHADQIIYLDNGRALGIGTFDELLQSIPNFAKQAQLLGIS